MLACASNPASLPDLFIYLSRSPIASVVITSFLFQSQTMSEEVQGLSLASIIQKRISLLNPELLLFSGKKYVDVLNPSGQSSSGSAMLPSSFLPTFPGPVTEFNPAQMFVPAPVPGNLAFLKM